LSGRVARCAVAVGEGAAINLGADDVRWSALEAYAGNPNLDFAEPPKPWTARSGMSRNNESHLQASK